MDRRAMQQCAELVVAARRDPDRVLDVPVELRPSSLAEGYRVQEMAHALLAEHGWGTVAGVKIGATTPAMQSFLGVDEPLLGGLWSTTVTTERAVLDRADHARLGLEGELAVTLAEDVTPVGDAHDIASARSLVASWHVAIEVVDDRYRDLRALGAPTIVADDVLAAGAVLGPAVLPSAVDDIAAVSGRMTDTGEEIGTGTADALLGHPLTALAWLAGKCRELGRTVPAGSIVLLGSLLPVHWVPGASRRVTFAVDGLGSVEVTFRAT